MRSANGGWIAVGLHLEFCGERFEAAPGGGLTVGREGDIVIDDNPYLHRRFLQVVDHGGLWWLVNLGEHLSATVSDPEGRLQAWLAPGARLPLVFERTIVRFTAGPTTYELELLCDDAQFNAPVLETPGSGDTTIGRVSLTPDQHLLILSLAEPALRLEGRNGAAVPSSSAAALRLGWTQTRFNRKLDNVCDKLDRVGVRGLRGDVGALASNRRARLVEYAIASGLVRTDHLPLLTDTAPAGGSSGSDEEA